MFHKPLCGSGIPPACEYCQFGQASADPRMILCDKRGVVSPGYHCRKYVYDPLQRIPRRKPKLPGFKPEDFSLE